MDVWLNCEALRGCAGPVAVASRPELSAALGGINGKSGRRVVSAFLIFRANFAIFHIFVIFVIQTREC